MYEENTSAHADHKEAYKSTMQALDVEEQLKAQMAALDSMQHAAADAKAPILEQQEANIRDRLRCVHKEHLSV